MSTTYTRIIVGGGHLFLSSYDVVCICFGDGLDLPDVINVHLNVQIHGEYKLSAGDGLGWRGKRRGCLGCDKGGIALLLCDGANDGIIYAPSL